MESGRVEMYKRIPGRLKVLVRCPRHVRLSPPHVYLERRSFTIMPYDAKLGDRRMVDLVQHGVQKGDRLGKRWSAGENHVRTKRLTGFACHR